jgi:broad specificity phosphatase PhoE
MSTLLVVRHGAAAGYGGPRIELTAAGLAQARALGAALAARGRMIDHVVVGPSGRHHQTLEAIAAGATAAGRPLPAAAVAPALDEYPAVEVVRQGGPSLAAVDPEAGAMLAAAAAAGGPLPERALDRAFARLMQLWGAGSITLAGVETFAAFRARVDGWLAALPAAYGRRVTVLAVTSAGPVAAVVGRALEAGDAKVLDLSFVVRNAGVTELRVTNARLTLVGVNDVAHLAGPDTPGGG